MAAKIEARSSTSNKVGYEPIKPWRYLNLRRIAHFAEQLHDFGEHYFTELVPQGRNPGIQYLAPSSVFLSYDFKRLTDGVGEHKLHISSLPVYTFLEGAQQEERRIEIELGRNGRVNTVDAHFTREGDPRHYDPTVREYKTGGSDNTLGLWQVARALHSAVEDVSRTELICSPEE